MTRHEVKSQSAIKNRTEKLEGKSFFGGTAYLGIPSNKKFKQLVFEGINRYGLNFGASRNSNLTLDIFSTAEHQAAKRSGAEAAIIVSSGYLAAQLVVQNYTTSHRFIYAPETHPALWIGKPNPPKMSFSEWAEKTVEEVNKSNDDVLLITNSVNNLLPEIYEFDWLTNVHSGRKLTLLIDDSHGIGIIGQNGEGSYSRVTKLPNISLVVVSSMAKALGVDAGLILSTEKMIARLRTSPIYSGASPPSPGVLYAYANALDIYKRELEKLRLNMQFFIGLVVVSHSVNYVNDFPVFLLKNPDASERLMSEGISISSFGSG